MHCSPSALRILSLCNIQARFQMAVSALFLALVARSLAFLTLHIVGLLLPFVLPDRVEEDVNLLEVGVDVIFGAGETEVLVEEAIVSLFPGFAALAGNHLVLTLAAAHGVLL
jgi:hypothetical protein